MAPTKAPLYTGALLLCVLVVVNFQRAEAQGCGQFQASCSSYVPAETDVQDGLLAGMCSAKDGSPSFTTINLNDYIGNSNGVLVAENGGMYGASCKSMSFALDQKSNHVFLHCKCKTAAGTWVDTSIDVSQYIANDNGNLDWREKC